MDIAVEADAVNCTGKDTLTPNLTILLTLALRAMQGEVLVYVMPGMFVPNAAQSMKSVNGKRATRCGLLRCGG